ncbi:MAG: endolytic transglycosylase MltG [Evtepia sp.]
MPHGKRTEQSEQHPTHKPKKNSLFSNSTMYLLFIFGIAAILTAILWSAANDILALNKKDHSAVITISETDNFNSVVKQLKKNHIIHYKGYFHIFSVLSKAKDKVVPGTYELDTDMDYRAIINNLGPRSSSRMTTLVTIPEGFTVKQVFAELADKGVSTVDKLEDMAATHDYAFSFLDDIPMGDPYRLEGYLFPDTYEFYMGEDPLYVLNKMLLNFDLRVPDDLRKKMEDTGYSVHDIITIASMIEKESDGLDRGKISSVIRNRLKKPTSESAGYLNVDATLQYVLPEGRLVTQADYETLDSPYNSYKHKGLPPGPIANPGLEAIQAAITPENTSYYYYALDTDGHHQFFKTFSEHKAFLNKNKK